MFAICIDMCESIRQYYQYCQTEVVNIPVRIGWRTWFLGI